MPPKQYPREYQFDLSGGHPALDFANTVSRRDSPEKSTDHLTSYEDFVSFARQSNLISSQEAESIRRAAQSDGRATAQAICKAIEFREGLYRVFTLLAKEKPATAEDVSLIRRSALEALRHRYIARTSRGYQWQWEKASTLERLLWPIAESAAELLVSSDRSRVRECEAPDCAWLFLDTSRNHSRRWCDMKVCGNREKARRHYQRHSGH